MAVNQSSLLGNFLLPPAPLAVSLPLQEFIDLFPKSRRDDVTIPVLYRELQKQRSQDIERVKQNIAAEFKLGEAQQRHIRRVRQVRRQQHTETDLGELAMDLKVQPLLVSSKHITKSRQLFPEHAGERHHRVHNGQTLAPEMARASKEIKEELAEMEEQAQSMLKTLGMSIGDFSDLRYGRFTKTPGGTDDDLANEVIESLRRIQQLINA
jgi:centromere-localized protein 2